MSWSELPPDAKLEPAPHQEIICLSFISASQLHSPPGLCLLVVSRRPESHAPRHLDYFLTQRPAWRGLQHEARSKWWDHTLRMDSDERHAANRVDAGRCDRCSHRNAHSIRHKLTADDSGEGLGQRGSIENG